MKLLLALFAALTFSDALALPHRQRPHKTSRANILDMGQVDNYCSCGIVDGWFDGWDAADIWVDLIILIDTSAAMGQKSLDEATELITSFLPRLTTDTSAEYYTRIGVIAISDTAEVIYNLNMSSTDSLDMIKPHTVPKIDVLAGFQAALNMFANGEKMASYRENARQIVYYLTNSNPAGNMNGVDDFKTNGGIIVVNDFVVEGTVADPGLMQIASDNYFFTNLAEDYLNSLVVFCEANCFCSPDLHSFNNDTLSTRTTANRGCFHPVNNGIPQSKARETCQKGNATLVSIHDDEKEFFVSQVVSIFGTNKKYWLGYQLEGSQWVWDDKSNSDFSDWNDAQPNTNDGKNQCVYAVQTNGFNVKWTAQNCGAGGIFYVCESQPCSVGNKYC